MKRVREKQFMLDFTNEQHKNIKLLAAQRGMSMHELILVAIAELASKLSKKGNKPIEKGIK